jgi:hypothetical protein
MPDTKITALAAITTVAPANDLFAIVDVSDNSMAASGTTKNITTNQILGAGGTATLASATITGDLTVDTSTLKVDSANDRVGIGTATPAAKLIVRDGSNRNLLVSSDATQLGSTGIAIGGFTDNAAGYAPLSLLASAMQFGIGGSTAMTLNASGLLGLGVAPKTWSSGLAFEVSSLLKIASSSLFGAAIANNAYYNVGWKYSTANTANLYQTISGEHRWLNAPSGTADAAITFTQAMTLDASGNLLVGPTSSVYKLDTYTTLQGTVTSKQFANRTSNKIIEKRFFGISADTALFSVECGTAGAGAMAAFEINVFATGQKSGSSSDRQFYGKFYVTRNLAGTFTITSAFSSGSSGAFTVTASGTSLNVNGIFSVISDGSACVEITGYIGGRDTVAETALTVTMP